MTGYGRAGFALSGADFDVEVRSVNHRYLDVKVRLPRLLSPLEPEVRARVQGRFGRGKVDALVQQPANGPASSRLEIDLEVAGRYVEAAGVLRERYGLEGSLEVDDLLALPDVARVGEIEAQEEEMRAALFAALDEAVDRADAMRRTEGEALEREIAGRLARVAEIAAGLESRSAEVLEVATQRLRQRAEKLAREHGAFDEGRLHQEIVIAADRLDVTEEIVRLRSHVDQFRATLEEADGGPVGRRLDFLLQELGREANTIGSKGADAPVAHQVVELKTELERIREQVQNVE